MDCMSGPPIMAVNDINAHSSAIALETTFNVAIPQSYQDRKCLVDLVLENRVDYKRDIGIVNSNDLIHKFYMHSYDNTLLINNTTTFVTVKDI